MTNHTLEQRIRTAVDHAAPDVLDSILASCSTQKGIVIPMEHAKKPKKHLRLAATAAALVLVCAGAFGWGSWQTANAVDSVVMLDVNPSISLTVNARDRVISADALNEDAQVILGDMKLKGTDLEVAVNALIGSMVQNGYLDDLQNSILVSVENDDPDRSAQLQQTVRQTISGIFQDDTMEASVLTQSVSEDAELATLAEQYQISLGKAALIQEVIAQDSTLTFASLAPLTVNEIALITASRNLTTDTVTQTGSASTKAYITPEEAQSAAFTHAGVSENEVSRLEIEFDSEDGIMVYEVEFYAGTTEYDYDINARTAEVLHFSQGLHGSGTTSTPTTSPDTGTPSAGTGSTGTNSTGTTATTTLSESEAKAAVFADAGVSESQVSHLKVELDRDDGRTVYEIEFQVGTTEYEYKIDAATGSILKSEIDEHHSSYTSSASGSSSADSYIGEAAAKSAALSHAGVSESDLSSWEIELDHDDGQVIYKIEFRVGQIEYEYEIDAVSGSVLKAEQDD